MIRSLLRVTGKENDVLSPSKPISPGLTIPELQRLLPPDRLGGWALDAMTVEFLWNRLLSERPSIILECGAGSSTIVFAKYATLNVAPRPVRIASLEQSASAKTIVDDLLSVAGLSTSVQIFHAPLSPDFKYQFDENAVAASVGQHPADWIFIDGPAGPEGCRTFTLPALLPFCRRGSRWFLDDAFRDGELQTLKAWSSISGLTVEGIYPIGKGLATGTTQAPSQFRSEFAS